MKKVNLFIDRIYEDKVDLISDAFLNGFTVINYYKTDDQENIHSREIGYSFNITLNQLMSGDYIIYFSNSEEQSEEILFKFTNKSKTEYFNSLFEMSEKEQIIFRNLKTDFYIEELYKAYIDNKNEEYTETYQSMLNKLIDDYNNYNKYKNLVPYNLDIRFSNNHVLDIDFSRCFDVIKNYNQALISGSSVYYDVDHRYPDKDFGYFMTYTDIKKEHEYLDLEEGLYKFFIINDYIPCLAFYVLIPSIEEKENRFQTLLENKQRKEKLKIDSRAILESEYDFESEEEKEIVMNIEALIDKRALFSKPNLVLNNKTITFDASNLLKFNALISPNCLYLYGVESDLIYNSNAVPHKIKINNEDSIIRFNIDENYFNKERYYFYVGDSSGRKLSRITTLDLSNNSSNTVDYNEKYEHLILNTYIKNLYSTCGKHKKWGEVKASLDRFNNQNDIAFVNLFDYLYQDILPRLNWPYDKVEELVYNIELTKFKDYTHKNRNFMKSQLYKALYNTHVIPTGNYILEIKRINKNGQDIQVSYVCEPDKAIEIRVDQDQFIILRAISLSDFSVSDFAMYNNTGYGIKHFYNSLEVEVSNVL